MRLEGWHLIIIIAIAVLLFGAPKLPGLARSVGQSMRIFKSEVKQLKEDGHDASDDKPSPPTAQALAVSATDTPTQATDTAQPADTPRTGTHEDIPVAETGVPAGTSSHPL